MARIPRSCPSKDRRTCYPFTATGITPGQGYLPIEAINYAKLYRWYWRVKSWRLTLTMHPTSLGGHSNVYELLLSRLLIIDERDFRTGPQDEWEFGPQFEFTKWKGDLTIEEGSENVLT